MQFFLDYSVHFSRGPWLDILRNNTQTFIRLDVYMQKLNRWLGLYLVCTMFDQNQQITYIRVQQCAIDMSPMRDHEMFKQCLNRQTSTSRRLKGTYRVNHANAPSLLFSARFCSIMSFSKVIPSMQMLQKEFLSAFLKDVVI